MTFGHHPLRKSRKNPDNKKPRRYSKLLNPKIQIKQKNPEYPENTEYLENPEYPETPENQVSWIFWTAFMSFLDFLDSFHSFLDFLDSFCGFSGQAIKVAASIGFGFRFPRILLYWFFTTLTLIL